MKIYIAYDKPLLHIEKLKLLIRNDILFLVLKLDDVELIRQLLSSNTNIWIGHSNSTKEVEDSIKLHVKDDVLELKSHNNYIYVRMRTYQLNNSEYTLEMMDKMNRLKERIINKIIAVLENNTQFKTVKFDESFDESMKYAIISHLKNEKHSTIKFA